MKDILIKIIEKVVPLPASEAELILSYFRQKNFKRNEVLIRSGAVAREVFFVTKGLLHQYYIDEAGNERTCDFTFENKFVTDLESFTRKTPATSSVKALKPTSCLTVNCEDLTRLIEESAAARDFFNTVVEQIASESMKRTKSLLTFSPEQRFLELVEHQPDIFQLVSQRYIAQYLGIAPESLSRIKRRLMRGAKS